MGTSYRCDYIERQPYINLVKRYSMKNMTRNIPDTDT